MAEVTERLYRSISDATMLSEADTIHALFLDDIADFSGFDASLDAAFGASLLAAIDAARAAGTDEAVVDEISILTDTMNDAWRACRDHFQDAKYFIEKAHPNSEATWKSYGYDDYRDMARYADKVLPFMDVFEATAQQNSAALIAAGYTAAKISQIGTLRDAFRAALTAQNKAQKDRYEQTQSRIQLYNAVWALLQQLNKASKAIYRGNHAKLQQYLLPAPGTNENRQNLALTGRVVNSATGAPVPGAVVNIPSASVTTTTDADGRYGFTAGIPAGNYHVEVSAPGYFTFSTNINIPAEGEDPAELDVSLQPE